MVALAEYRSKLYAGPSCRGACMIQLLRRFSGSRLRRACALFLTAVRAFALRSFHIFNTLSKFGNLDDLPIASFVPRATGVGLALISLSGRIVEILIDQY